MAVTLRTYLNTKLKEKGMTASQAKKNASKYKSIAAAKKAGSLYYTNKDGKVMAAVYAEDLKKPLTSSIRPKARPKKEPAVAKPKDLKRPKVTTTVLKPRKDDPEVKKIVEDVKKAIKMPDRRAPDGGLSTFENRLKQKGNEAALKAHNKAKREGNPMGIFKPQRKKK
tara:strand:- start:2512 stop:3015 length:504 start_codon:yes stop_codon:yes gene_type:complete